MSETSFGYLTEETLPLFTDLYKKAGRVPRGRSGEQALP